MAKRLLVLVSLVGVVGVSSMWAQERPAAASSGSDPILGTWKVNVAKSTYNPGPPPPASAVHIRHYRPGEGGAIHYVLITTNPQGVPNFQASVFRVDGKQYPVYTAPSTLAFLASGKPATTNMMRAYRRIDQYSTEYITYNDGVPSVPSVRVVSKDGKTLTDTTKGKNLKGQEVHNVIVLERVQ
jgi:hypothetical protein